MFSISNASDLDTVVFDLHWGYPRGKKDYLDATCFAYGGGVHRGFVDDNNCSALDDTLTHTALRVLNCLVLANDVVSHRCIAALGDLMDDARQIGHHIIEASMKRLPQNDTRLYSS
eukprot:m.552297 g.552297  ORF g.552297 m.552297 type:complete len:116 (-) comp57740_c1_seq9:294-641(-)